MGRSYKSTRTAKARGLELLRLSSCIRRYPSPYIRKRIYGLVGSEVKWASLGYAPVPRPDTAHGISFLRITMVARSCVPSVYPSRRGQVWARLAHLLHGDSLSKCEVIE